ncbi:hypothetical protein [Pseudomonas kurunegalensis]|uniref:hypothetical protein n=1 Tax=Pseudomonas kurunegalensis TaxID=485880 RepID=UPI0025704147|nr:hypothetical protein [Pseudomonas kurunegalensis]WJD60633.1 hypothetical protein QQ992_16995 [Pseudomonas kurunegalensis]
MTTEIRSSSKVAVLPMWVIDRIKEEMRLGPAAWQAITDAVEQAEVPQALPCEVKLPPGTVAGQGSPLSTLLMAMAQRASQPAHAQVFCSEPPAPQPHPEPMAWMVGTAFWWTKGEAERDAAATGLPIVGLGPMTDSSEVERLVAANTEYARRHLEQLGEVKRMSKATAFVQRLVDCSGTQPSVATGYLRDILDELKGNTTPTAPVDRDERAAFEHHHRICDLVRDEDCPEDYRNQSVQDSWEGWQARAEWEIRP